MDDEYRGHWWQESQRLVSLRASETGHLQLKLDAALNRIKVLERELLDALALCDELTRRTR
jgi:hypothetical protein